MDWKSYYHRKRKEDRRQEIICIVEDVIGGLAIGVLIGGGLFLAGLFQ